MCDCRVMLQLRNDCSTDLARCEHSHTHSSQRIVWYPCKVVTSLVLQG